VTSREYPLMALVAIVAGALLVLALNAVSGAPGGDEPLRRAEPARAVDLGSFRPAPVTARPRDRAAERRARARARRARARARARRAAAAPAPAPPAVDAAALPGADDALSGTAPDSTTTPLYTQPPPPAAPAPRRGSGGGGSGGGQSFDDSG
jgi:membrane protein involved in colicin uptake